jgi:DNA-binding IclR family transcriptional regulator
MSQTVDRALVILDYLADGPRTLADISGHVGVHKSTAWRLVRSLELKGMVSRDGTNSYKLGARLFALAFRALASIDVRALAAPHLRRLATLTGQTIHLAILEGGGVFYADKYEGPDAQTIRMYSRLGRQAPLHCTAVAKAIVAFRPEVEQRTLAERITYTAHTRRTLATPAAFLAELSVIRSRGYAVDDREHEEGIHCVGAPIATPGGEVSAAISIAATTMSLSRKRLLALVPLLLETAKAIEREFEQTLDRDNGLR